MRVNPWDAFDSEILPHLTHFIVFGDLTESKKSTRSCWTPCPFHQDRCRSFLINPKNLIWYCKEGCGGGGPVEYIQQELGCSWIEAAQTLARRIGKDFPQAGTKGNSWTEDDFKHCRERNLRHVLLELFSRQTQKLLLSDRPLAGTARGYLDKRGFSLEIIRILSFGLYTCQEDLAEFVEINQQYLETALAMGMLQPDWVGRITGQWRDIHGRVINVWGRYPGKTPHGQKRYITLSRPWTDQPFGHISTPFNLDRAARAGKRDLLLVESPLKALLPYTLGLGFKIGPFPIASNTRLIEDQRDILADYLGENGSLTLCMNYDPKSYGTERDRTMEMVKKIGESPYRVFTVDPILMAESNFTSAIEPDTFILTHGGQVRGLEAFVSILARCPGLRIVPDKTDDGDGALTRYIERDLWGNWSRLVEDEILESE